MSYCAGLPNLLIRVESDDYTEKLRAGLEAYSSRKAELETLLSLPPAPAWKIVDDEIETDVAMPFTAGASVPAPRKTTAIPKWEHDAIGTPIAAPAYKLRAEQPTLTQEPAADTNGQATPWHPPEVPDSACVSLAACLAWYVAQWPTGRDDEAKGVLRDHARDLKITGETLRTATMGQLRQLLEAAVGDIVPF
jgi:hypothetical protein